jgi:hypothetical protein
MHRPPFPHPLYVLRSAEVIPVARLREPAALSLRLAGGSAGSFRTVFLSLAITRISRE